MSGAISFNPPFDRAMSELCECIEAHKPRLAIVHGIIDALRDPRKLLCWVGDVETAIGAPRVETGFYASDLFVRLLSACQALDWEVVAVILKQAESPQDSAPALLQ